jgi:uncharacterized protein involved in outer membrane biogenesis
MTSRVRITILSLIGAVFLIGAAVVLLLAVELGPLAGWYVTRMLGRPVTVASVRLGWSHALSVELRDIRLANVRGATEPDMLRIDSLSATISLAALLHRPLRFESLVVGKPMLRLERAADGMPNWHFKQHVAPAPGAAASDPAKRRDVPTLIDFALREGAFIYRGSSGAELRLDLDDLAIRTDGDDRPVTLALGGRYNTVPITLKGTTDSFAALHDAATPFGTRFSSRHRPPRSPSTAP